MNEFDKIIGYADIKDRKVAEEMDKYYRKSRQIIAENRVFLIPWFKNCCFWTCFKEMKNILKSILIAAWL